MRCAGGCLGLYTVGTRGYFVSRNSGQLGKDEIILHSPPHILRPHNTILSPLILQPRDFDIVDSEHVPRVLDLGFALCGDVVFLREFAAARGACGSGGGGGLGWTFSWRLREGGNC